MLPFLSL
jgi:exportin-1